LVGKAGENIFHANNHKCMVVFPKDTVRFCMSCGKKMKMQKDKNGKLSKYIWKCSCMPRNITLMIG
jgi:rRNA maturation endonuclease Nob1